MGLQEERKESSAGISESYRAPIANPWEDPTLCCQRFDPSADIFGAKKSSMSDLNADRTAKNGQTLRYKMRTWRPVGSDVLSVCGHL